MSPKKIRIAITSLYNNVPNQGMRSIKAIIERESLKHPNQSFEYQVFESRYLNEHPNVDEFDIFISTGGPGDPFDGIGQAWEGNYFKMLDKIQQVNSSNSGSKKFIFSICHSFQLMCRYFNIATVNKRRKPSFGVFPCHVTWEGQQDVVFQGLDDPFYIVDSRDWQCVDPQFEKIHSIGGQILSVEKYRPHVNLQQALMAIRVSPEWMGTQFHPEADPIGMRVYFNQEDKRQAAILHHGDEKFFRMLNQLEHPNQLIKTNQLILPNFLASASHQLRPEQVG